MKSWHRLAPEKCGKTVLNSECGRFYLPVSKINAKLITKTLIFVQFCGRPPRRGAWIEIVFDLVKAANPIVAPRAGGRGLKSQQTNHPYTQSTVAPRAGGRGLKFW